MRRDEPIWTGKHFSSFKKNENEKGIDRAIFLKK